MGRIVFELLVMVSAILVLSGLCVVTYILISKLPMMLDWLSGVIGEVGSWVIFIFMIVGIISLCIEKCNKQQ